MACYSPLKGYQYIKNGKNAFTLHRRLAPSNATLSQVSCNQCIGCKIQRSKDWAIRCVNEMHNIEQSMFLTFTYDPEHVPKSGSLNKQHLTQFFDSFKKYLKRTHNTKIRYYACGEYGELKSRPHYHALIFGFDFDDREPLNKNLDFSPRLNKIWGKGMVSIGTATIASAAYISKYITKKISGDMADGVYLNVDKETGEILNKLVPEYTCMSTGIGRDWLDTFYKTDLTKGFITHEGVKFRIPRYYMERLEKHDSELHASIKESIKLRMDDKMDETYERLLAREKHAHLVTEQELRDL